MLRWFTPPEARHALKPSPIEPVPEGTARVARAAFRKGNPLLKLRDELGAIFADADFADLFPKLGQPGLPPWRLALVTLLQFREDLPDRQAAEAVRARIDWKYLLGLELDRPGLRPLGAVRVPLAAARGRRRGAALGQAAGGVPGPGAAQGARAAAHRLDPRAGRDPRPQPARAGRRDPACRPERAGHRRAGLAARGGVEGLVRALRPPGRGRSPAAEPRPSARLTRGRSARTGSPCSTGSTGRRRPRSCGGLPKVGVLRQVWERHFVREGGAPPGGGGAGSGQGRAAPVRGRAGRVPVRPRGALPHPLGHRWVGYVVHLSETCDDDTVHLITHALTTVATVHEARCNKYGHEIG